MKIFWMWWPLRDPRNENFFQKTLILALEIIIKPPIIQILHYFSNFRLLYARAVILESTYVDMGTKNFKKTFWINRNIYFLCLKHELGHIFDKSFVKIEEYVRNWHEKKAKNITDINTCVSIFASHIHLWRSQKSTAKMWFLCEIIFSRLDTRTLFK